MWPQSPDGSNAVPKFDTINSLPSGLRTISLGTVPQRFHCPPPAGKLTLPFTATVLRPRYRFRLWESRALLSLHR